MWHFLAALSERREVLEEVETITAYGEETTGVLQNERSNGVEAFIHSVVKEIAVAPGAATIRYTIPMPGDIRLRGGKAEDVAIGGPVLLAAKSGRKWWAQLDGRQYHLRGAVQTVVVGPTGVSPFTPPSCVDQ